MLSIRNISVFLLVVQSESSKITLQQLEEGLVDVIKKNINGSSEEKLPDETPEVQKKLDPVVSTVTTEPIIEPTSEPAKDIIDEDVHIEAMGKPKKEKHYHMSIDVDMPNCNDPIALAGEHRELLQVIAENAISHRIDFDEPYVLSNSQLSISSLLARELEVKENIAADPERTNTKIAFKKAIFQCAWILELITPTVKQISKEQMENVWAHAVEDMSIIAGKISKNVPEQFVINPDFYPVEEQWFKLVRVAGERVPVHKFEKSSDRLDQVEDKVDAADSEVKHAQVRDHSDPKETTDEQEKDNEDVGIQATAAKKSTTTVFIVVAVATISLVAATGLLTYLYITNKRTDTEESLSTNELMT